MWVAPPPEALDVVPDGLGRTGGVYHSLPGHEEGRIAADGDLGVCWVPEEDPAEVVLFDRVDGKPALGATRLLLLRSKRSFDQLEDVVFSEHGALAFHGRLPLAAHQLGFHLLHARQAALQLVWERLHQAGFPVGHTDGLADVA